MKPDTEIDFSEAIRNKNLDDLRFESTKDKWIKESQKDFLNKLYPIYKTINKVKKNNGHNS